MSNISLPHGAWVIVADGEKALFLHNKGDHDYPHLEVFREEEQDNPPNREQAANRRGRFNDGPGAHRSAVEDTDWHQLGKERFAKDISETLYAYAHKNKFDKLVIVAPPMVLGEMRKELHQEVQDRIVADIDKTLTNHPIYEIEEIIFGKQAA